MRAHQLDANGVIVNTIIVASLDDFPNVIDASIGGEVGDSIIEGVVMPRAPAAGTQTARRITVLAFRNRFTPAEKVRIEMASLDNPAAVMADRTLAAAVRVGMSDLAAATYVNLDRADTRAQVQNFEAMHLLDAPGRALEILDAPIQPQEAYEK